MRKQLLLSLDDLEQLVLACADCGTEITFGVQRGLPEAKLTQRLSAMPGECPVCSHAFDASIREGAEALLRTIKSLYDADRASRIIFRLKPEAET
jgi:hypothetical protein